MGLKPKQQLFLTEYLKDMNATQAAIRAGYSPHSAYSMGQKLLKKGEIREEIQRKLNNSAMKADEILQKLTEIARADMGDYLDVSSMAFQINLAKAKADDKLKFIRRIRQKTTTICKEGGEDVEQNQIDFELLDQMKALELLAKYHGLLVDKHEIRSAEPIEIVIRRVNAPTASD